MSVNRQAILLDMYYKALRRNSEAEPPEGLDTEIASIARALSSHVKPPEPSPGDLDRIKANIFRSENHTDPPNECRCSILRRYGLRCQSCPTNYQDLDQTRKRPNLAIPLEGEPEYIATSQHELLEELLEMESAGVGSSEGSAAAEVGEGLPTIVTSGGLLPPDYY
jgi:hypothetical protein